MKIQPKHKEAIGLLVLGYLNENKISLSFGEEIQITVRSSVDVIEVHPQNDLLDRDFYEFLQELKSELPKWDKGEFLTRIGNRARDNGVKTVRDFLTKSKWELGRWRNISMRTFLQLADLLEPKGLYLGMLAPKD